MNIPLPKKFLPYISEQDTYEKINNFEAQGVDFDLIFYFYKLKHENFANKEIEKLIEDLNYIELTEYLKEILVYAKFQKKKIDIPNNLKEQYDNIFLEENELFTYIKNDCYRLLPKSPPSKNELFLYSCECNSLMCINYFLQKYRRIDFEKGLEIICKNGYTQAFIIFENNNIDMKYPKILHSYATSSNCPYIINYIELNFPYVI